MKLVTGDLGMGVNGRFGFRPVADPGKVRAMSPLLIQDLASRIIAASKADDNGTELDRAVAQRFVVFFCHPTQCDRVVNDRSSSLMHTAETRKVSSIRSSQLRE